MERIRNVTAEMIDSLIRTWLGLDGARRSRPDFGDWGHSTERELVPGRAGPSSGVPDGARVYPLRRLSASPHPRHGTLEDTARHRKVARRLLNVGAASALLVLTAPIMLLTAAAVRITSPGPILYTQPRVGLDRRRDDPDLPVDPRRRVDHGGRIFRIYKFRTMIHRPEEPGRQVWAAPQDPRITPVGRVLRRYRLDELPQLLNVLKGDMNLVGPRPEQPEIFKRLRESIDEYPRRQKVLPGITGLAQVSRRYDRSVEDVRRKVELDLAYMERESPVEDLRIMAETVPVVLFGKGAI